MTDTFTRISADQGTCHGFRIRSSLAHPTLVAGPGTDLAVEEIAARWKSNSRSLMAFEERRGRLPLTIHAREDGRFDVATTSLGVFEVDPNALSIGVPASADPIRREMLTLGTPLALVIQHLKDLPLHAAAFSQGEKAVVVTGRGGGGKSTLTAAALAAGWRVLGDDLVRVAAQSSPTVYQGPSVARIRDPSMDLLDLNKVSVLARSAGKIHLLPRVAPINRTNQLPIAAVLVLIPDAQGPSLEDIPSAAAVPLLWKQSFYLPDEASRAICFDSVVNLSDSVPVFRFGYPHNPALLSASLDRIGRVLDA